MNAIAARILAAGVAALAIGAGVLYVRGLRADLAAAQLAAESAQEGNRERDRAIGALAQAARANAAAREKLEQERAAIRATLDQRQIEFRRLTNENAALRAWADSALPGVVIGMHDHATITGADGYQQHMRARDALHAAGRRDPH